MFNYLAAHLATALVPQDPERAGLVGGLAFLWSQVHQHLAGFGSDAALFGVCLFWCIDWILGGLEAVCARNWSPKMAAYSCFKLVAYIGVLLATWWLAHRFDFLGFVPRFAEISLLLAEGTSVVRNAARLAKRAGSRRAAKLLQYFASKEDVVEAMLRKELDARLAMAAPSLPIAAPPAPLPPPDPPKTKPRRKRRSASEIL